jgi:hypothetical protein
VGASRGPGHVVERGPEGLFLTHALPSEDGRDERTAASCHAVDSPFKSVGGSPRPR